MKIKTSELIGAPLNWAVAKVLGRPLIYQGRMWPTDGGDTVEYAPWAIHKVVNGSGPYVPSLCHQTFSPSTEGSIVLDLMERENIFAHRREEIEDYVFGYKQGWVAVKADESGDYLEKDGLTLRIAVCRAFIASVLGDEVEVPDELMEK